MKLQETRRRLSSLKNSEQIQRLKLFQENEEKRASEREKLENQRVKEKNYIVDIVVVIILINFQCKFKQICSTNYIINVCAAATRIHPNKTRNLFPIIRGRPCETRKNRIRSLYIQKEKSLNKKKKKIVRHYENTHTQASQLLNE